jgi:hypothetical protein
MSWQEGTINWHVRDRTGNINYK